MIAAVAGMGEFAIKYGAPPIATRIMGAQIMNPRYDYERSTFRLDYETISTTSPSTQLTGSETSLPVPSSSESTKSSEGDQNDDAAQDLTPLAVNTDLPVVDDNGSLLSQTSSPASMTLPPAIECELRCDIDTWATSLDIIVDPAPQTITGLRRHKLASGGSGLWLTVEHDPGRVADERISIVVRKGGIGSKDRGSVIVNGVKLRIDVEELPEHEVQSLTRKKRIKPTRIPLDRPPVHSVARRRGTTDEEDEPSSPSPNGMSGRWAFAAPLGRLFSFAADQSTSTPGAVSPVVPSPDARSPMHCAFEALTKVRELHSQSISDGWTLVSEKDVAVYRKIDARISSKIAIHKAQRIVEGYGAEEIAAAISNVPSRTQWDDRIDSVSMLDSYGAGCSTAFAVMKAGFPFRDRGLFVASLVARIMPEEVQERDADTRQRTMSMTSAPGRGRSPPPKSQPPALICISASFATVTPRQYSSQKINPFNLPIGQILVEGWILETLDPYTSENLAIPSTRCTLITAVDLAGSVPLSYTQSHNQANVRAVLALERYLKGKLPPPYSLAPAPAITIDEIDDELARTDGQLFSWQLGRVDTTRQSLSSLFIPEDRSYRLAVLINPNSLAVGEKSEAPTSVPMLERPSTALRISGSAPGTSKNRDGSPARSSHFRSLSRASTPLPTAPATRSRTMSTAVSATLSASTFSEFAEEGRGELLICELVLDASLYKTGCNVKVSSRLLPQVDEQNSRACIDISPIPTTQMDLKVQSKLYPLPASTLASNSLSSPLKRYILRVFISTAQYQLPTIVDPLTGNPSTPPSKPEWLTNFEKLGAVVDVSITAAAEPKFAVLVNELKLHIDRLPLKALSESERLDEWPRLQR